MQGAPKYKKIILTWRPELGSTEETTSEFEDCGMVLTADKIIIVKDTHDSVDNLLSTEGSIFELSDLKSYKTYKVKGT